MTEAERLKDVWWCNQHHEIHQGDLQGFTMEHRIFLHPVYVHWHLERLLSEPRQGQPVGDS